MRIGLNNPQDVLALLVRRKWWVIAPFIGLSCILIVLTTFLPKMYVSEALILVRPRDVPQDFVKDLISGSAQERLLAIEQTVLSRTNLLQILREFGDSLPEFDGMNMDQRVEKLRSQIVISYELEKSNGRDLPLSYFHISYQNQSPEIAQKIASRVTTLFIEKDNQVRESQVEGTTEFLSTAFQKVSDQLTESEEKLKQLKSSRQFELPDQRDANLRTLDRLAVDKKTNAESLDRYETQRLNLENQLSETQPTLPRPVPAAASPAANPLVAEYRKAEIEYQDLLSKYTELHPDVVAAKLRLQHLKSQIPPDVLSATDTQPSNSSPDPTIPNPLYESLSAQLRQVKTEYDIREKEKDFIDSEIAKYNQRVESTPKVEEDLAEAQRQNDDLKKQYEDLKGHLDQARLSQTLESEAKGSQFQVVDPANYPLEPTKPSRKVVALASCGISFVVAILIAAAVDIARQRVWTQSEIEAFWGVPVLVDIPEILTDSDLIEIHKKKVMYAVSSVTGFVVYVAVLYLVYIRHSFILERLNPLLQKVLYK